MPQAEATLSPYSPPPVSDEMELVASLLHDDAAAWREFNRRYAQLIRATIGRIVRRFRGVVSEDDASEIYANFCMQLLANDKHKLRCFDPTRGSKLGSFLSLLASHAAYDFLRSVRRAPRSTSLEEVLHVSCNGPDPLQAVESRRSASQVAELLSTLSEKDRQFMLLYFGEGLSPELIACKMGINVKTVYSKKHKIRARLEGLLSQHRLAA